MQQLQLITAEEAAAATRLMHKQQLNALAAIVQIKNTLNLDCILQQLATFYGIPLLDLAAYNCDLIPKNVLSPEFIASYQVIPLAQKRQRLHLAVVDPTNQELFAALAFKLGVTLELTLIKEVDFKQLLLQLNKFRASVVPAMVMDGIAPGSPLAGPIIKAAEEQPLGQLVDKIIMDAVFMGASDIHFEPYEESYRIRYRLDGVLYEMLQPPLSIKEKIIARIKIIAQLDIAEKRLPQDGRLRLVLAADQVVDFRVSTLPTVFGEKLVLRILDPKAANLGITHLGLEDEQQQLILKTLLDPYGLFLVTGPTGCGKTITLYSCLNLLNHTGHNISTVEDPVEIPLYGINQVAINEKIGLTFSRVLRAFLRQDPDVIMVGEIRDQITAEIAIKAAQTGHLVLSTLHTNDSYSAVIRLNSMGIPCYNLGDAILMVIAQRLVRKLCANCKSLAQLNSSTLKEYGFLQQDIINGWQPFKPVGCNICHNTGYCGRTGIFELLPISAQVQQLILGAATATQLAVAAQQEGWLNLRQSGLLKVRLGVTSLSEVLAHTRK